MIMTEARSSSGQGIRLGDRINIVDDNGALYVSARVLKMEVSETEKTTKFTLGDYIVKSSGISEQLQDLANQWAELAKKAGTSTGGDSGVVLTLESSAGAIFKGTAVSTTLTAHVFRGGAELSSDAIAALGTVKWYRDCEEVTALSGKLSVTIPDDLPDTSGSSESSGTEYAKEGSGSYGIFVFPGKKNPVRPYGADGNDVLDFLRDLKAFFVLLQDIGQCFDHIRFSLSLFSGRILSSVCVSCCPVLLLRLFRRAV